MGDKDIISKQLLKRMTLGMARILLGLEIVELEIMETGQQRVEERRADVVAKVQAHDSEYLLHIETQNDNQSQMPKRMLRYLSDILLAYPGIEVKQYLIYIGMEKLTMSAGLSQTGLNYCYQVLDMHNIACDTLLRQNTPEALVLAILSDFGAYSSREIVHRILQGLQELTGSNEAAFRDYLLMLEILSGNSDLEHILQEEETMLSQVKYSDLPSYGLGMQKGMEQGMEQGMEKGLEKGIVQGEAVMLQSLLQLKFGSIPDSIAQRIQAAGSEELLHWSQRILSADSLADIFAQH